MRLVGLVLFRGRANGGWAADYNDFFTYNFPLGDELPPNVPRPALDVGEATRVILMKINVNRIEWPEGKENVGFPITHFKGFSRSLDGSWDENANSDLRGESCLGGSQGGSSIGEG